jgi:hypothetical protein
MKIAIYIAIALHFIRKLLKKVTLQPDTKFMPYGGGILPDDYVAMVAVTDSQEICLAIFHCKDLDGITNGKITDAVQKILDKVSIVFYTVGFVRKEHLDTLGTIEDFDAIVSDLAKTPRSRADMVILLHQSIASVIEPENFELA